MFSAGRSWTPPCLRRALALSGAADRPGEPKIPPGGTIAHVNVIPWLPTLGGTTPVSARTPGPRRRPELSDQFGQRGLSRRQRQVARAALRQASERQQHQQRLVRRPLPVPLILAQRREPAQHASTALPEAEPTTTTTAWHKHRQSTSARTARQLRFSGPPFARDTAGDTKTPWSNPLTQDLSALSPIPRTCCDRPAAKVSHLHSNHQRLTAQTVNLTDPESPLGERRRGNVVACEPNDRCGRAPMPSRAC